MRNPEDTNARETLVRRLRRACELRHYSQQRPYLREESERLLGPAIGLARWALAVRLDPEAVTLLVLPAVDALLENAAAIVDLERP